MVVITFTTYMSVCIAEIIPGFWMWQCTWQVDRGHDFVLRVCTRNPEFSLISPFQWQCLTLTLSLTAQKSYMYLVDLFSLILLLFLLFRSSHSHSASFNVHICLIQHSLDHLWKVNTGYISNNLPIPCTTILFVAELATETVIIWIIILCIPLTYAPKIVLKCPLYL